MLGFVGHIVPVALPNATAVLWKQTHTMRKWMSTAVLQYIFMEVHWNVNIMELSCVMKYYSSLDFFLQPLKKMQKHKDKQQPGLAC